MMADMGDCTDEIVRGIRCPPPDDVCVISNGPGSLVQAGCGRSRYEPIAEREPFFSPGVACRICVAYVHPFVISISSPLSSPWSGGPDAVAGPVTRLDLEAKRAAAAPVRQRPEVRPPRAAWVEAPDPVAAVRRVGRPGVAG